MILDGKRIATQILEDLEKKVGELQKKNIIPHLAVILIGDDVSSHAYVRQKELKIKQIGAKISVFRFSSETAEDKVLAKIKELNDDFSVHGIIIQRPLPSHIDGQKVTYETKQVKDVDGFSKGSPFEPPIALAVTRFLDEVRQIQKPQESTKNWLLSKNIVLLGKGKTAGIPIIYYFKKMEIPLNVIDSTTEHRQELLKKADIVISAVGKRGVIHKSDLKPDVILIGVGMSQYEGMLAGDYDKEELKDSEILYTPIPGGVGPVNVAYLLSNLVLATEQTIT